MSKTDPPFRADRTVGHATSVVPIAEDVRRCG